jgi:putative endopeptidase
MRLRFLSLLALGCATPASQPAVVAAPAKSQPAPSPVARPKPFDVAKPMPAGLDETAMNLTADPCSDFYEFACGGWMQKTEIPGDKPMTSRGFVTIADANQQALKTILEEAAASKLPAGTPFGKQLGDAYATCTDEAALEKGVPVVSAFIKRMQVSKTRPLAVVVAELHLAGFAPLFNMSSMQDLKDSSLVIAGLDQGGLGLPDRDYYVEQSDKNKAIRESYVAYIEAQMVRFGVAADAAKRQAQDIMALETRLAQVAQTKVERRDPKSLYNRIERAGLLAQAKDFDWAGYFKTLGQPSLTTINVNSVKYFQELSTLAKDTKPEVLNAYLTWVIVRGSTAALPKAFQDAAFTFASKNFTGAKEDRPRWKKCVEAVDEGLGEALGREFARRFFPEESKQRTSKMIEALQGAVQAKLDTLPWLDAATREAAKAKATRMVANNKIGYPSKWRDYASMQTSRVSYFDNLLAFGRFDQSRQLAKIGKPVDRTEWFMSPPTVNAYYDPQKNEIVFPAGILQPPFFNKDATDAVNLGAMGMVVGHEISHGFDDEGRQFDVDGNLKDWWSEAVAKQFDGKAKCVKTQFDGYAAIDDLKVKGDLTLGENIADLSGLTIAHEAMTRWYSGKPKDETRFNVSQQFFVGYAQSWCTKMRPEMARMRAMTDPHAPPFLRVRGPLSNLPAFREAFMCREGDAMVRTGSQQCAVF